MPRKSPLGNAWQAYLITLDALKVSQRASQRAERDLFKDLLVLASAPRRATSAIVHARERADELVILAMYAEFERHLIGFLERHVARLGTRSPRAVWRWLARHLEGQAGRWRPEDTLDLLKGIVDSERVGQVKQVKQFRDWVAHKNPRKLPPAVDPATAYQLLSDVIVAMEQHAAA